MRILVLNGPNLQLLGSREPEMYGSRTLEEIMEGLVALGHELGAEVAWRQSNEEGALVTAIGESRGRYDGLLLNAAAYTHTSVALGDALRAAGLPCVEVHLSNTAARERFRRRSFTAPACLGQVMGFGADSYRLALEGLVRYLQEQRVEG